MVFGGDRAMNHVGLVALGGAGWMGGANYIRGLAAAIRAASPETNVSFVCGSHLLDDWRDSRPLIEVATHRSLLRRLLRPSPRLATTLTRSGVEFLYPVTYTSENNLGLPFPRTRQLGTRGWAGWVPDFQHRHMPEFFSAEEIAWRDDRIARLVAEAPRVAFSSESAAADFRSFFPEHSAKASVLTFATPPLDLPDAAPCDADLPARFLLVCNQFWKHKNHQVIFDALRILRTRGVTPSILCTGKIEDNRDPAYIEKLRAEIRDNGLDAQVKLLGLIPRVQQVALMRRAIAIIQPSLFEGWSTIVEDARALGRPCLLSDIAVHREQNPPGAHYFPARSAEALADLIATAWADWPGGPDRAAEDAARTRASERLAEVGSHFLALAAACR